MINSSIQLSPPADGEDIAWITSKVRQHPILAHVSTNFHDTASVALQRYRAHSGRRPPRIKAVLNELAAEMLHEHR